MIQMFYLFFAAARSEFLGEVSYDDFVNKHLTNSSHKFDEVANQSIIICAMQPYDGISNSTENNYTRVVANWAEYSQIMQSISPYNESSNCSIYVELVQRKPKPDVKLVGNFWIPFIGCMLGGLSLAAAYFVWCRDDYVNQPENSLIFATEGQKLVSGK